jgi:outer membrane protein OmpA-like peptidoglycan-associated protein
LVSQLSSLPFDNSINPKVNFCNSNGEFEVALLSGSAYAIEVEKENYLFYSNNLDIPYSESVQMIYEDIYLKKAIAGNKIVLKNVFFDSGKSLLKEESKLELEIVVALLKKNTKLVVEVSGHTDNIGSDEINLKLSEERAKAVYDFLISKGVPPNRLQYKGYGKNRPIADNLTEEGRQKNRRTEFEIISN